MKENCKRIMAMLMVLALILQYSAGIDSLAVYATDSSTVAEQEQNSSDESAEAQSNDTEDKSDAASKEKTKDEAPEGSQPADENADADQEKPDPANQGSEPADPADVQEEVGSKVSPEEQASTEEDAKEETETVTQTVREGDAEITAEYNSDIFKEDVKLKAREIAADSKEFGKAEKTAVKALNESKAEALFAYDITFVSADGTELEPTDAVKISIRLNKAPADRTLSKLDLVHIKDDGKAEMLDEAKINKDATKVEFENDQFSVYVVTARDADTYTVGEDEFATLNEAIGAINESAGKSGVIWVVDNVTEDNKVTIPSGTDIAIKVADGKTLTINNTVEVNGTLELNEGIVINGGNTGIDVNNGGSLSIAGGNINATTYGIDISTGGLLASMSDGKVTVTGESGTGIRATNTTGVVIGSITGGEVTASGSYGVAVYVNGGEISEISGGKFTGGNIYNTNPGSTGYALGVHGGAKAKVTGGTFTAAWGVYVRESYLEITGGTFNGSGQQTNGREGGTAVRYDSNSSGTITGGKFTGVSSGISALGGDLDKISNVNVRSEIGRAVEIWNNVNVIEKADIHSTSGTGIYLTSANGHIGKITDITIEVTDGTGIEIASRSKLDLITDTSVTAGSSGGQVVQNSGTIGEIRSGTSITANEGSNYTIYNGSSGVIEKISGGTIGAAAHSSIYNRGRIGEITGTVMVNGGSGRAIYQYGGTATSYGEQFNTGVIETISGGTFKSDSNYSLENNPKAIVTTISGGTFDGNGDYGAALNQGQIGTISGGTFGSDRTNYALMLWMGKVDEITGSALFNGASMGIWNYDGRIDIISGGVFTGGSNGIDSYADATIGTISGGEFNGSSGNGLSSAGKIDFITGGTFTGGSDGMYNSGTVDSITGGNYTGNNWFGIWNNNGTISKIAIAKGTNSVFKGPLAGVGGYFGIGVITGYGVYIGGSWNAIYGNNNVECSTNDSLDLTKTDDNPGYGRYRYDANEASGELQDSTMIPDGYHMSKTTTSVSGQQGEFRFLTKDNTIIYDGNGHKLASDSRLKAAENVDGDDPVFVSSESAQATVLDSSTSSDLHYSEKDASGKEMIFNGWNTKADGTGTAYKAGDTVTIPAGEEVVLYAQWGKIDVTYYFDYIMGYGAGGNGLTISGDWYESRRTEYAFDKYTLDMLLIAMENDTSQVDRFVMEDKSNIKIDSVAVLNGCRYKLKKATVNDTEVTDLTNVEYYGKDNNVIKYYFELEWITLYFDGAGYTGIYDGQNHEIKGFTTQTSPNPSFGPLTLAARASDERTGYKIHAGSNKDASWAPDMTVKNAGSGTVEDGLDLTDMTPDEDGYYTVPADQYRLFYGSSMVYNWTSRPTPIIVKYKPGTWKIDKKDLKITPNDQTHTYNGSARGENNSAYTSQSDITAKVIIDGLAELDDLTKIVLDGKETYAGVYNDKIEASGAQVGQNGELNGNYNISYGKGKLTINEIDVTFVSEDTNKGTVSPASAKAGKADAKPGSTATPKTGYHFVKWTGKDDAEVSTSAAYTAPNMPGSYTAHFNPNTFTVSFNANEGTGDMADQQFTYDVEQALTANSFTKEGYTYTGWNTKADGTGEAYKDEQSVKNLTAENGATVTLYAQWKANQYTITFDSNGGTPVDPITQAYGTDVTAPEDPTREGYTFDGWDKKIPSKMPAENTTITAKWTPIGYTITYDLDGGSLEKDVTNPTTYTVESDDITLNNPKKEGYTFNGWTGTDLDGATKEVTIEKGSTGDRSYTATWTPIEYTITFDSNGGSPVDPITQAYGTDVTAPKDPVREGYTFDGWDKDIPATMPAENMTITAKWKVNQYKVTYKYLGEVPAGASELPSDALHDFGSKVKMADPAAAPGYTFSGWSKKDFTMPAENVEITGTFTAKGDTPYKVEHYKEMTEDGKYQLAETEDFTGKTGATVTANPKTYEGFSLNSKAGGAVESGTIAADGSLVLKLFYDRNEYTITFDSNGGSPVDPITQDYGTDVTAPKDPTREGYTFDGWEPAVPKTMPAENMTIAAKWKINQYEIIYDLNGGEYDGSTDNIVETYDYNTVINIHEAPTREGYEFLYWKGSEYQPGDSYTVTEDHLFTAQWEEVAEEPEEEEEEPAEPEDTAKPGKAKDKGVKTGDKTDLMAIGGIFGASLLGLLAMIRRRKREQQ